MDVTTSWRQIGSILAWMSCNIPEADGKQRCFAMSYRQVRTKEVMECHVGRREALCHGCHILRSRWEAVWHGCHGVSYRQMRSKEVSEYCVGRWTHFAKDVLWHHRVRGQVNGEMKLPPCCPQRPSSAFCYFCLPFCSCRNIDVYILEKLQRPFLRVLCQPIKH